MAGKKDKAVIAVISGLTDTQAAEITKGIMQTKNKHAPLSRGTIAFDKMGNVSALLQKGTKKLTERKK